MKRAKLHVKRVKKSVKFSLLLLFVLNIVLAAWWGTITLRAIVASRNQLTQVQEINYFKNTHASFQDVSRFYRTLAMKKGAVYAFSILKQAVLPPNIDTHLMGHVIGDVLFQQQGIAGMRYCTEDFRNACSHSIVVGAFLKYGEAIIPQLTDICHQAPGGKGAYTMCFHGLGHGVLAFTDYDMPKAVTICQKMGTIAYGNREASECVGGTTMEMIVGVHDIKAWSAATRKYFKKDDPLYPCDSDFVPDDDKTMCYVYLTPHLFQAAGADISSPNPAFFNRAFHFCDPIQNPGERNMCYGGFGKEFIALVRGRDIRDIGSLTDQEISTMNNWCNLANDPTIITACITQTDNSLYWGGEVRAEPAIRLCEIAQDPSIQSACFSNLIHTVGIFKDEISERNNFCGKLPSSYKSECFEKLSV